MPMTTPLAAGPSAKFTSDGGREISLDASGQSLGRSDLHGLARPDKADLLSRRHFSLSYENGDYYIEDRGSTNGTRLNGSDVRGKGKQLLKDGDRIELAGALTITFKS
jgi:pSer/pThr/pTyr-binding forkhead associated (FHA) protein